MVEPHLFTLFQCGFNIQSKLRSSQQIHISQIKTQLSHNYLFIQIQSRKRTNIGKKCFLHKVLKMKVCQCSLEFQNQRQSNNNKPKQMSLKENASHLPQSFHSEAKKLLPPLHTARKLDDILKQRVCMTVSQSKFPLGQRMNGLATPMPGNAVTGESKMLQRIQMNQQNTLISHFDKNFGLPLEDVKNDLILGIVPKDPHLTNLAETLERQAKEYQQKQLIESFPLRYADLLSKQAQLSELQMKYDNLEEEYHTLYQNYQNLKAALAEREVHQIEKQNKIRLVLEESEAEREKLIEAIKLEFEIQLRESKDKIELTKVQFQIAQTKNKSLLGELEELVGDRDRKEQQVQILAEAIKDERCKAQFKEEQLTCELQTTKRNYEQSIRELKDRIHIITENASSLTKNLSESQKNNENIKNELSSLKKQLEELTLQKGVTTQKINRLEQQRLQLKVQLQSLRLDYNQSLTIKAQKQQQLDSLKTLIAEQNEQIENHSFVVAQLTGQITLKQVELGDKTADILTLKQKVDELAQQNKKINENFEKVSAQKIQVLTGVTESQEALRLKIQNQNETITRLQDQIEFVKKQHTYLLTIRQEMEDEVHRLKTDYEKCSEEIEMSRVQKLTIEEKYRQLHTALEEALTNNQKEYESLKEEVEKHVDREEAFKQETEVAKNSAVAKIVLLEEECQRLKGSVDRHIKALAEKQFEHDKVVAKLIEVSNSRPQQSQAEITETKKKIQSLTLNLKQKEEQIKSLQALLRDTRATILSLSDSLKERSAREKQLFDQVLSEKKRMKRQIEQLENELKSCRK